MECTYNKNLIKKIIMKRAEHKVINRELMASVLKKADVCRIGFAHGNIPYIVTLNFGFKQGSKPVLYFHCGSKGRKLEMMARNNYVCFEMDTDHTLVKNTRACGWSMKSRSIVGYGYLSVVNDTTEMGQGLDLIMDHYGGSGSYDYDKDILRKTVVLRLEISEFSARSTL